MTTVPPELEEAARDTASMYVLTDDEFDRLVSDERFASMAYLREETAEWIEVIGFPFTGEYTVDEDDEISAGDVESIDQETPEGRAIAQAWYGYNAYVEASEAIAEAILGRELDERAVIEALVREKIKKREGEL